ncbi:MAG: adenine/guanine/hypoxanthine permease [Clostridiales bacterium]|jgi:AGZA family xanthine/uracil permease-like MFS transporter|nr:adenine/guanine/hypoxanthine permease [Clostridiales bacterium]
MDFVKDLLAALSVILNGLPQGLLALSFGFASVPTALAFVVGAVGSLIFGVVAPISFQAETITLAGTMGKNMRERLSMIFFGAAVMALIGIFGLLERIVTFVGPVITSGMMAGVGIMLTRVSIDMARKNKTVGFSSIGIGFITYMFTKDLVYTIAVSVIISSIIALSLKQKSNINITEREKFVLQKFTVNADVIRGAMAMVCLNIGANIAFGKITGEIAQSDVNIDHLSIYSSLADMASSLFGGGPVESIISATGSAPHPLLSGVLMMSLMAVILFAGLLPKIGKYIPSESIAGFLFVLGAIVTVPINATAALNGGGIPGGSIVGGLTMTITAITDPFLGMLAGLIFKLLAGALGM